MSVRLSPPSAQRQEWRPWPPSRLGPPRGVLFSGPSGTGKTLMAKALAGETGMTLIVVDPPTLLSKWVGESEKGLREGFKRAKQASPCIVLIVEIEAMEPALPRAGRFDFIIDFPLPSREERIEILQAYMRTLPLNSQIDIDALADMSDGWTGADIEAPCKKAVMLAVEECFQGEEPPDFSRCKITSRHFEQAALQGSSSTIQSRRAGRH